ncbi:MAG: J domain-containing protein [Pseudomonadales bacterium]|nr:J domain-containing protein [Pseudomonadales bacterium]
MKRAAVDSKYDPMELEIKLQERKVNRRFGKFLGQIYKIVILMLGYNKTESATNDETVAARADTHHRYLYNLEPDSIVDCYKILGLDTDEPRGKEVKAAYRKLIWLYHPDKVETASDDVKRDAHIKSLKINAAYELLVRNGLTTTECE